MLDVFKTDAFSTVSLTDAILKAPYRPGRLASLFRSRGITTTTAVIEEKNGRLELIPNSPRGGVAGTIGEQKRTARSFVATHLEKESTIMADSVQGVRAFGSEDSTVVASTVVNERLQDLRAMHEVTLEHMRAGAIKGQILDADGSTVLTNLFTEFNVVQQTLSFALGVGTTNVRNKCVEAQRMVEGELGAEMVSSYVAICGDSFFDDMIAHAKVENSLQYQESRLLRTDLRSGFEYGGITFENYRGSVNGVAFFPTNEAYLVPVGPAIFSTYFAPADFMETVNTVGLPLYAKMIEDKDLNRWAKVHTQSNPLVLCTRPRAVIKLTKA